MLLLSPWPLIVVLCVIVCVWFVQVEVQMFDGQVGLQVFLVLIVFLSVPTMLVFKPLILRHQHKQEEARKAAGEFVSVALDCLGGVGTVWCTVQCSYALSIP